MEIWTVLDGRTISDLRIFFRSRTETYRYYENIQHFPEWLSHNGRPSTMEVPTRWMKNMMLLENVEHRAGADELCRKILEDSKNAKQGPFCGDCCLQDSSEFGSETSSDGDPLANQSDSEYT
jgi:hypothetical protein